MTAASDDLARRALAEFLGTAFLLAAIVGSGAMAQSLTDDVGLQLLQNAFATSMALGALIITFGATSGAHFNPAVTLASRMLHRMSTRASLIYLGAQITGAVTGVIVANVMFERSAVEWSNTGRTGWSMFLAEGVATFGLVLVILLVARSHSLPVVAAAVAAYIGGAFVFTSSTSFANPAVTLARTLTDSFAGIDPAGVPAFLGAQVLATVVAVFTFQFLDRTT